MVAYYIFHVHLASSDDAAPLLIYRAAPPARRTPRARTRVLGLGFRASSSLCRVVVTPPPVVAA